MIKSIVLAFIVVFCVILAGLLAGAETGMYQLSRVRLRLGIEKKRLLCVILGKVLRDSGGLLISMLIGTNLLYYLIASIVTYILLGRFQSEHTAELAATVLTAPVLFVFSELIPKNIFFHRPDTLMPGVGPILFIFHKILRWCGVVPALKIVSRSFARLAGSPFLPESAITAIHQPHIKAIIQDTREEGILSAVQSDIINRLTGISYLSIRSVMTPIGRTQTVNVNSGKSALLKKLKESTFARLPVYDRWPANIIGFVNIYDCLSRPEQFSDLRNFVKPIRKLSADTTVIDAINVMQSEKQRIVLVMRTGHLGRVRPIGIVTMKDLVEELLGELTEW